MAYSEILCFASAEWLGRFRASGQNQIWSFNKRFFLVRESSCPGEWAHCLGLSPRFPWRFYRIIINCPWGSGRDYGEVGQFYGEGQPASPLVGCGYDVRRLLPRAIKGPPPFGLEHLHSFPPAQPFPLLS